MSSWLNCWSFSPCFHSPLHRMSTSKLLPGKVSLDTILGDWELAEMEGSVWAGTESEFWCIPCPCLLEKTRLWLQPCLMPHALPALGLAETLGAKFSHSTLHSPIDLDTWCSHPKPKRPMQWLFIYMEITPTFLCDPQGIGAEVSLMWVDHRRSCNPLTRALGPDVFLWKEE